MSASDLGGVPVEGLTVAFVLGTSAGGVGRHVHSAAAGLTGLGARVLVLGPAGTEELFGFTGTGARFVPVEISARPHPIADIAAVGRLRRLLRTADVVHAHGLRAGGLAALALGGILPGPRGPRRGGPPLVVTLHNAVLAGGLTAVAYGVLERIVARGATQVLGVSADLEERMRELGAARVGHALVPAPPAGGRPGPAARAGLRAELGVHDRPLVLTVARLADQKGLPALLDAAAGWAERSPRPLAVIAGDGPLEQELRARIDAGDLPVRLLGRRADVPALMAAADVVVVPSRWEGQPLVVQEALRAGRPLVTTRVGGIPGLTGEDAALFVPAGDPVALRRAVEQVLDEPALALRLAAAAARRATELPAEADAVAQLAGLYHALASR